MHPSSMPWNIWHGEGVLVDVTLTGPVRVPLIVAYIQHRRSFQAIPAC